MIFLYYNRSIFRSKLKSYYEFYRNQGVIENFKFTDKVFHRSIKFPVFIDKRLSTHNPNKISNNPIRVITEWKVKININILYITIISNSRKVGRKCTPTRILFSQIAWSMPNFENESSVYRFLSKMQTRLQGIRASLHVLTKIDRI